MDSPRALVKGEPPENRWLIFHIRHGEPTRIRRFVEPYEVAISAAGEVIWPSDLSCAPFTDRDTVAEVLRRALAAIEAAPAPGDAFREVMASG